MGINQCWLIDYFISKKCTYIHIKSTYIQIKFPFVSKHIYIYMYYLVATRETTASLSNWQPYIVSYTRLTRLWIYSCIVWKPFLDKFVWGMCFQWNLHFIETTTTQLVWLWNCWHCYRCHFGQNRLSRNFCQNLSTIYMQLIYFREIGNSKNIFKNDFYSSSIGHS